MFCPSLSHSLRRFTIPQKTFVGGLNSFDSSQVEFFFQKIQQTKMRSHLLSNPNLSTPFLPHQLSCQNTKKAATPCPISRRDFIPRCSVETPYGGNVPTFPRGNVWDPYKRLGVSPYASEEEIWGSHNFLLQQYAGRIDRSCF